MTINETSRAKSTLTYGLFPKSIHCYPNLWQVLWDVVDAKVRSQEKIHTLCFRLEQTQLSEDVKDMLRNLKKEKPQLVIW